MAKKRKAKAVKKITRRKGTLPRVPLLVKLHVKRKKVLAVVPGGFVNALMDAPVAKVEVVGPITAKAATGPWEQLWRDFVWYFK